MAKHIEPEVAYYYDFHPTEEDLMGETSVHATLVHYLIEVLTWLLQGQTCAVYENLNFYQTPNPKEYPLAPDIAVIKGVDFRHGMILVGQLFKRNCFPVGSGNVFTKVLPVIRHQAAMSTDAAGSYAVTSKV